MDVYGNVTDFAAFMGSMGYEIPAGDQSAALLRGSMSLDATYHDRWVGEKASYTQDRDWPRVNAYWPDGTPVEGIPVQVVTAAYQMSYRELVAPGSTSPVVTPGSVVQRARVEGAVEVEYARDWAHEYDRVTSMTPIDTMIEGLLGDLIDSRVPLPAILVV